jgi:hypothetical protein
MAEAGRLVAWYAKSNIVFINGVRKGSEDCSALEFEGLATERGEATEGGRQEDAGVYEKAHITERSFSMYRFSLLSPLRAWKKGDSPVSPFVHLSLGTYMQEQDHVLLSAQLMTDREIDEVVNSLKGELDEFGKTAKKELKELREKMLQR